MIKLLVHTCEVWRRVQIADKGLSAKWTKLHEGVRCLVLPATPNDTLNNNLVVGKDYNAYFEADADVKEGDKLVVSTGVTVMVKGYAPYKDLPNVSHLEFACETEK